MQTPSSRARPDEGLAIVTMGVSGCGKSTLGALLARRLGCAFLEGDAFHDETAVAKMRAGRPLTDEDRWPWLDRLGLAIKETLASEGQAVAACSALRLRYRERLRAAIGAPVRFVLLDASREELLKRMTERADHYMPVSLLDSQLATLERPSAEEQVFALDALISPDQLCDSVQAWLSDQSLTADAHVSGH
ncbi:gluconokinase, GntK/IdnK-type [uncultured Caulobacter sp.]|uniref:gluconokinase n=1 Tax=uncultured Caulobacter sp. TaxID=158749 RepID=UPI00261AF833|nr:gluconokinase, GntK/IdnK-type [uncultured Caulobacter sp.]